VLELVPALMMASASFFSPPELCSGHCLEVPYSAAPTAVAMAVSVAFVSFFVCETKLSLAPFAVRGLPAAAAAATVVVVV